MGGKHANLPSEHDCSGTANDVSVDDMYEYVTGRQVVQSALDMAHLYLLNRVINLTTWRLIVSCPVAGTLQDKSSDNAWVARRPGTSNDVTHSRQGEMDAHAVINMINTKARRGIKPSKYNKVAREINTPAGAVSQRALPASRAYTVIRRDEGDFGLREPFTLHTPLKHGFQAGASNQ